MNSVRLQYTIGLGVSGVSLWKEGVVDPFSSPCPAGLCKLSVGLSFGVLVVNTKSVLSGVLFSLPMLGV